MLFCIWFKEWSDVSQHCSLYAAIPATSCKQTWLIADGLMQIDKDLVSGSM